MERPIIRIEREPIDNWLDALGFSLLGFMIVLCMVNYFDLPETIPTHFNSIGEADGYGSKFTIWVFIAVSAATFFVMLLVNKNPHRLNYLVEITEENAREQYALATRFIRSLNAVIMSNFLYITYAIIASAKQGQSVLGWWFLPVFLISIFAPIGLYLYQSTGRK